MRLIDADAVKQKYRDKFIESLVDKDRGIDLSEYAEEPSKSFNRFIDEIPTVCNIEQIRAEIKNIRDNGNLSKKPYFYVNRCLQIVDNNTKGVN